MSELKDILKPPFGFKRGRGNLGAVISDATGNELFIGSKKGDYGNNLANWFCKAINNELEREYGEPKRWIWQLSGHLCPDCDRYNLIATPYCPSCGQRLLPPEEK